MAEEPLFESSGLLNIRKELKEINMELSSLAASGQDGSARFTELAQRAAEIRDAVDDSRDAVAAFTGAGQFQAVTKAVQGVAGGFTAIQGAIGLVNTDSKAFEKTMQKLQSAMALTQGLAALEDVPRAFKQIQTVGVTAFNAIKGAISATGIGLLVVALGTIVAYWDEISAAVSGVSEEQEALNKQSADNLKIQEENLAAIDAQENILKLQGKSEEEIYQMKVKQYDQTILAAQTNLANIKATAKAEQEATERNKEYLQMLIRMVTAPITVLLAGLDEVGKFFDKDWKLEESFSGGLAELVFDPEEVKKEGDASIKEAEKKLTELENKRAGLVLQHNEKQKQERQKRQDDINKANEEENKKQEEHLKNIQKLRDEQYINEAATEEERERRALERKQEAQDKELQQLIDAYTKKKKLTKEEEETLAVLRKEYDQLQVTQKTETDNLLTKQNEAKIKKQLEDEAKAKDEREKAVKEEYDKTVGYVDEYYKARETALINSDLSEREMRDQAALLELERLQAQKVAAEDYGQSVVEIENQIALKKKEIRDNDRADFMEDLDRGLQMASDFGNALARLDKALTDAKLNNMDLSEAEREKIAKESFEKQKKFQIALAIIDGAKMVTSTLAQYPKFDGGIAMYASLIVNAATIAANLATIMSTKYESKTGSKSKGAEDAKTAPSMFAEGGLVTGPGTGTSDSIDAKLSNGEFVINAESTRKYFPLLEKINRSNKSIPMMNFIPDKGGNQADMLLTDMMKTVDMRLSSLEGDKTPIKAYVVSADITSTQEKDAKISQMARLD